MNSLVSIIIPTFNRAHLIGDTLNSVLAQTYHNWECIIVDDGSLDNTIDLVESYKISDNRFKYFKRPENRSKGPSACRNSGLENANGEYVIFLDSDDLLTTTCLENRIAFARKNNDFDFWIFKMTAFFDTDKGRVTKFNSGEISVECDENLYSKQQLLQGIHPFLVTCPLWKRNMLIEMNGFDENLRLLEDLEFHLRVILRGYKLKYANGKESDCYCRKDYERTEIYHEIELDAHFYFFQKYLHIKDKKKCSFFKRILNDIVFKKASLVKVYDFFLLGVITKSLSVCDIFFGLMLYFYNHTGLCKFQGLGYNFLKQQFNNF